jgi:uncharacterized protein YbaR (Trm112 family)
MIDPAILRMLRCPETQQELRTAEAPLLEKLNQQIGSRSLLNRAGQAVEDKIDAGLIRADGKFLYPVRRDIPVMLPEESIPL